MTTSRAKSRAARPGGVATTPPKKAVPALKNEAEERGFWEVHDSTEFVDWGRAVAARLPNLKPSTQTISLRLPLGLLERIKIEANRRDIPYQSLIKSWLSERVGRVQP
jgi:predicted DNA binding CopG/RHH family protein